MRRRRKKSFRIPAIAWWIGGISLVLVLSNTIASAASGNKLTSPITP